MTGKSRRQFLRNGALTLAGSVSLPAFAAEPLAAEQGAAVAGQSSASKMIRGVMVDAGRLPESLEYYRRLIEFCAEWKLNTLQFRLADDQGSALRFASVPGLVNHANAFTPDQLRSLAEFGASHGVDVLPELESFGHTGYITRSPTYAHLLDSDARGSREFSGVSPVDPESLQLFQKLYGEVAAIFPCSYLHSGCDEVNWGGSALSQKALQSRSRAQIWADYLNALNSLSTAVDKQMIVWGDFVLHKEPEILPLLAKNIILMDWNYSANNALPIRETMQAVLANGSRAIGAPALTCYGWGARVGTEQLRNIDAYADSYFQSGKPGVLGVVLTNWIPSRYLQDSIWDGFAYAAVAFEQGTAVAQTSAFHRFVEQHYRAPWNESWDQVFATLYNAAPHVREASTVGWMGLDLPIPWSNDVQLTAVLRDRAPRSNPFTQLLSILVSLEPTVRAHLEDFKSFKLCVAYLEGMFWREAVVVEQAEHPHADESAAVLTIRDVAERDQALAAALTEEWNRGRFADSPALTGLLFGLEPRDELLYQWHAAANYSASLAQDPDRFYALLQSAGNQM